MLKKNSWNTRLGFYIVAIGAAMGLGNMWRFPYVVGENGGGAFVLLYVFLALTIGTPLLIAELILGKKFRKPILPLYSQLSNKVGIYSRWFGFLTVITGAVVLSYYSVISGWVLHFLTQFLLILLGLIESSHTYRLQILIENGWLQFLLASAHILIIIILVGKGIREGLERWMTKLMPFFALLVIMILLKTTSLSSTPSVFRFLFYPDFSKLTLSSLAHAIGHVFFTLSVGLGVIVTYGNYLREEDHVPSMGFKVAMFDTVVSLLSLLIIFPIAFQASSVLLKDPILLFDVLLDFFNESKSGELYGFVFFLGIYLAALNVSVGILEMVVSNVKSSFENIERSSATWISGLIVLLVTIFPALSSSSIPFLKIRGQSLIEGMDSVLINWILPIIALCICFIFNQGLSDQEKEQHFVDREMFVSVTMYPHWLRSIKWIIPTVIIVGLMMQVWDKIVS